MALLSTVDSALINRGYLGLFGAAGEVNPAPRLPALRLPSSRSRLREMRFQQHDPVLHVYIQIHLYMYIYIYMCACMYIYIYVCTYSMCI